MVPPFRGSSRFECLILSHHLSFTYECSKEDVNDDDDDEGSKTIAAEVAHADHAGRSNL